MSKNQRQRVQTLGVAVCVIVGAALSFGRQALAVALSDYRASGVQFPAGFLDKNLKDVLEEREVYTQAALSTPDYRFISAMKVHARVEQTKRVLTQAFEIYASEVPYVQTAEWDPIKKALHVVGGVWKYMLSSWVRFEDKPGFSSQSPGAERVGFKVIDGHFTGLEGDLLFFPLESSPNGVTFKGGTLAVIQGKHSAPQWPPGIVMEQGAALVMNFTAKRMRRYIENINENTKPNPSQSSLPQPRRRF